MRIRTIILSGVLAGLVTGAVIDLCGRVGESSGGDERLQTIAAQIADHPDARTFVVSADLMGYKVGVLNGYVTRCVPNWKNKLAGPPEIGLFLGRMGTPDAITESSLNAFAKGLSDASAMTCGEGRSAEISAGVMANSAAQIIRELTRLAWVPAVLFHRGTVI